MAAVALGVTAPAGAVVGELPPEVAQPLCDVLRQAMTEVSDDLKAVHDGIGCQDVPPGEPGGDPLADVQAQACAELANLAKEAEKNGAPAELVAGLQTVRRDVVGCPTDAS
ncbi:MAG TPA: hypothetical protein VM618_03070, partial [Acidimicrobiia bacterium]|nr:hypothetical protein [Acidimicrobiia bacterium]